MGRQFRSELDPILDSIDPAKPIPEATSSAVRNCAKQASPWARLKVNGRNGLSDAIALKAFDRISEAAENVGLLINPEGELEGLCRTVSRSNKGDWLNEALKMDLSNDNNMVDARALLTKLRAICEQRARM